MKYFQVTILLVPICIAAAARTIAAEELQRVSPESLQFRRPAAIQRLDEDTAIVANRNGTLSIIDLENWSVVSEFEVGGRLTDLALSSGRLLVTDADRSQLLVITITRRSAQLVSRIPVANGPVTVRAAKDGKSCSVASLWSRTLTIVRLPENTESAPAIVASVELPFAPREQVRIDESSQVIVADSFSGRLAVISTKSHKVETVHEFGAHNIRGLAVNPETGRLLISHQVLNHRAVPRRSDIVWGVMIDNMIRESTLEKVVSADPKAMQGNRFISVGYAGQGAGDPDSLFVDGEGRTVIALAGVGQVSIVEEDGNGFRRVAVGRRPVALMPISNGRFVVVNELSDSLSLVDLTITPKQANQLRTKTKPETKAPAVNDRNNRYSSSTYSEGSYGSTYLDSDVAVLHLTLGPTPEPGSAERGEALFFDARLSHANWFSCHSCHTDGHTNGGMADTFGDESTGAPKRVLSLLGVRETGPWGWNGKKQTLLAQVHQSGESTMKGTGISTAAANDLVAYLDTLQRPPRFLKAVTPEDTRLVTKGRGLFESLNCAACHRSHTLTSDEIYDVGLTDERGLKMFSPPSLRGVGHRYRLFHDNRATGVEDVVTRFRHQLSRELSPDERRALIRYLKSL